MKTDVKYLVVSIAPGGRILAEIVSNAVAIRGVLEGYTDALPVSVFEVGVGQENSPVLIPVALKTETISRPVLRRQLA